MEPHLLDYEYSDHSIASTMVEEDLGEQSENLQWFEPAIDTLIAGKVVEMQVGKEWTEESSDEKDESDPWKIKKRLRSYDRWRKVRAEYGSYTEV